MALLLGLAFGLTAAGSALAAERPLVAVIDGGVAMTPELQDVLVAEYDLAAHPPRPAFQPRFDHGTYVATILHRAAKGGVDIVSLRIDDAAGCPEELNPPCQPDARPIAAAIDKAVALGADAINISLALKNDPLIVGAVRRASAAGVRVVLAAGNNGADHPRNVAMAVAGHPNTVIVGALDPFGERWTKSNRPDARGGVDYNFAWRPGVDVETVNAAGAPVRASGTSMAAPMETAAMLANGSMAVASTLAHPAEKAVVVEETPAVELEVTTASSAGRESALDLSGLGWLSHGLAGFVLALALRPLARRLAVRRR